MSEQAAEQLLDERLRAVERSFRDACKNAELLGNETTTAMLSAVHNAANSYVEKQVEMQAACVLGNVLVWAPHLTLSGSSLDM